MSNNNVSVHVAVGVITNSFNEVLIAHRFMHLHQGNCWEFPGGKVEHGESVFEALCRELKEEIAITVHQAQPLDTIEHAYLDKHVTLNVMHVTEFEGEPSGAEGQPIQWVSIANLHEYEFPAANHPIIQKVQRLLDCPKSEDLTTKA